MQYVNQVIIHYMQRADPALAVHVHKETFERRLLSYEWLDCQVQRFVLQ